MRLSDFSQNAPGKVIRTLQDYLAFIPNPLPPALTWTDTLTFTLSEADRRLARLAELGNAFPIPRLIARPFARQEAVRSSQIEGTHTTFEELLAYEAGGSRADKHSDAREVQNYVKALDQGLFQLSELPMSMRLICEIHKTLMQDVCGGIFSPGEIRRSQNWIGRPGATLANARYVPPPPDAMHDCLSELERYIYQESQLPPLVRIALIHYQFEAIHPFLDGNGRIGRLLISLLLVDWGLFSQPLLNLSRFFEDNRQEYYDRLLAVSQSGQWEEWLTFFLTGVATQAKDVGQRIEALNKLRADYRQSYQDDRSRGKLAQFVDFLIGTPITSVTQARESLDIGSFTTIQRLIDKLEALGILREVTGQRRNRLYQADEILRLLTR